MSEITPEKAIEQLHHLMRSNSGIYEDAITLAIAALKGPVIDDDMVERAVMAHAEASIFPTSRNGMRAALTAAFRAAPHV